MASTESRNINFRANLLQAYENGGPARCPVLGSVEPNIVAAHLFKHVWQDDVSRILHFKDIDDARNGLLLYTPIKRAFDSSQIVIIYESDSLVLHLLDRSIANDFLWEKAKQMCGSRYRQPSAATMKLRFRDLDGKALTFTTSHRPYFRCLNFHARSARRYALEQGWIRDWDFPDFWSEEKCAGRDLMSRYLTDQQQAVMEEGHAALDSESEPEGQGLQGCPNEATSEEGPSRVAPVSQSKPRRRRNRGRRGRGHGKQDAPNVVPPPPCAGDA